MTKRDILENLVSNIYLGIGSNLGNKRLNIENAKSLLLENNIYFDAISNSYETPSWPDPKKPKFINIVVKVKSYHEPSELLRICKSIEFKLGRRKSSKNSPRVCDIDIIDFNKLVETHKITLPHKLMHKRSFVLIPLFEIEKSWFHPIKKKNIKKLILSLPNNDIRSIKKI